MSKEFDRVGIPVAVMCTIVPIACAVGANRVVPTTAIAHPLGNPGLSLEHEKALRKRLVEQALLAIGAPA